MIVIDRLREKLAQKGLDAVLMTGETAIRYFSGFTSVDATVVVTKNHASLLTDFRYTIQAKEQCFEGYELVEVGRGGSLDAISKALDADNAKKVGFEDAELSVAVFNQYSTLAYEFVPFSNELCAMRILKSAEEVESLRLAQAMADRAFMKLLTRIHSGMTEKQVAAELNYLCSMEGSEGPSFDPIVGSGPNGAMCHAVPSDRKLQKGDLVVLDFGCIKNGYHSDMTRTFAVGEPDEFSREIYAIVLESQTRGLNAVRAGITGKELDSKSRDYIVEKGYGECFGHSLGHGFGLQIHEAPSASTASKDVFEAGMTITIEPGIYIEGRLGVRIEDCVVVTEDGMINFATASKELLTIE